MLTPEDIIKLQDIASRAQDSVAEQSFPPLVQGRILHADADTFSYKACNLDESLSSNIEDLKIIINTWRRLAGAEFVYLHLTMGAKGGREDWATVKQYQANRKKNVDLPKKERVRDLRQWMAGHSAGSMLGVPCSYVEADDSLCQAMHNARIHEKDHVLYMQDKDGWMIPGKHIDPNTYEIVEYPYGYGKCTMTTNALGEKKLKGKGTSWFWHQLLMGDAADNIPGLPFLSKDLVIKVAPPKKLLDIQRRISSGLMPSGNVMTGAQTRKAYSMYQAEYKKLGAKKIGPVLAHKLLEFCISDQQAYNVCLEAYAAWYGERNSYTSWNNMQYIDVAPITMLIEQARLLWMQMYDQDDVATRITNMTIEGTNLYGENLQAQNSNEA